MTDINMEMFFKIIGGCGARDKGDHKTEWVKGKYLRGNLILFFNVKLFEFIYLCLLFYYCSVSIIFLSNKCPFPFH